MIDVGSNSVSVVFIAVLAAAFFAAYFLLAGRNKEKGNKRKQEDVGQAARASEEVPQKGKRRKNANKTQTQAAQQPQHKRNGPDKKKKVSAFNHVNLVQLIKAHNDEVTAAAISNEPVQGAHFVASSSNDYSLKVWSVRGGKCSPFRHVKIGGDWASAMVFTPDGKTLVVAMHASKEIVFYEIAHHSLGVDMLPSVFEKSRFPSSHPNPVQSLTISPSNIVMTCGCDEDLSVRLWTSKGSLLQNITTNQIMNQMACMSPDGFFFAVATRMGDTKIYTISQKVR